jgi:hypothetical protein
MSNLRTELSPEEALVILSDDLLPRLTEQASSLFPISGGDQVAFPHLHSGLNYKADGSVEGYVDPRLIVAGLMREPLSMARREVSYGRVFDIDLWKDPQLGIIGVGMKETFVNQSPRQRITSPDTQQLIGRTYVTLAIAHSIDPALLRTTQFAPRR